MQLLSLKNKFNGGSRNINVLSLLAQKCDSYKESEICDQVYSYIYNNKLKFNSEVIFKSEIIFGKRQLEYAGDTSYLMSLKENYNDPEKQMGEIVPLCDYVLICVKPQIFNKIKAALKNLLSDKQIVISIMAGISTENLCKGLGIKNAIRVMPNTPGQIGKGISVWYKKNKIDSLQTFDPVYDAGVCAIDCVVDLATIAKKLKFDKIIVSAGAWSNQIANKLGDKFPLDTERGYHLLFETEEKLINRPVAWSESGFYLIQIHDGIRAAGTVEIAGLNKPPNKKRLEMIERQSRKVLPQLKEVRSTWMGRRPTLPDSLPVIGKSRKNNNVIYAFGHQHIGWTLGAVTGKIIDSLSKDQLPNIDISAYSPNRF